MATNDELHQIIARTVTRRADADAGAADSVVLWERLSIELIAIIGRLGFNTLYARSIHVVRVQHPWLPDDADPRFEKLRTSLERQAPALAAEASIALLNTFIDTLIQLIGEPLTTAIMRSAWEHDIVNTVAKGIQQ